MLYTQQCSSEGELLTKQSLDKMADFDICILSIFFWRFL